MLAVGHQLAAPFMASGTAWLQVGELGLALLLSAAIGVEREMRQKSAGLRTYTLVGVGAALFMLISKYGFGEVLELATARGFAVDELSTATAGNGRAAGNGRPHAGEPGDTTGGYPMVEVTLQVHGQGRVNDLAAELSDIPDVHAVAANDLQAVGE